ncbi:MAG TPA: hypothetical protein VED46_06460 [Alphaproteobacteria bacterium]|nr:hypothetical protein [Alphaproteobacteria bacterium]
MTRHNLMAGALYAVGTALFFGAPLLGESLPVAAAGLFLALLGRLLNVEWCTNRRLSKLEEQLAELKASQTESREGIAQ